MGESVLEQLRRRMAKARLDALLVPRGDAFGGEDVPAADERLAFVSGFTGSAGLGIITAKQAMLFSDGRYTLQMENQIAPGWECKTMPEDTTPEDWLLAHHAGCTVGFDPMLTTLASYRRLEGKLKSAKIKLKPLRRNPVDAVWSARPAPPSSAVFAFDEAVAGATRQEKIAEVLKSFGEGADEGAGENVGASHMLITDPAGLCWLLNIRARDLDYTPLLLAFALVSSDGAVKIYADEKRFAGISSLSVSSIQYCPPPQLADDLAALTGAVHIDPSSCPYALFKAIRANVLETESPITLLKAKKTPAEKEAFIAAHRIDAVAMIRFLHWFDRTLEERPLREAEVAEALMGFRAASDDFICPSFATICGGGGNGAIVHYRAIPGQDQLIPRDSLCLIDSGGHYRQATTDITRTIATGVPPTAMAEAFTHVLRAHIALAVLRFPEGATGVQLDAITRAPLWGAGMDYAHGTGHGVGCCLTVHEGPAGFSKRSTRKIESGLILSNEPGYYVAGEYGIRTENLVHVAPADDEGMLCLETISLVPIDRRLIIPGLLSAGEIDWINAYHRRIGDEIGPLLKDLGGGDGDDDVMAWLNAAIAPIG